MKTESEFKAFMAGEAGQLADAVFVAKARAQLVREQVDAYVEPIFQTYGFRIAKETRSDRAGELIAKSSQLYLAGDDTDGRQSQFFAACLRAHKANGFNPPPECCPALMAESDLVKAENALLKVVGVWLGFDPISSEIGVYSRCLMFGDNDEAFPSQAEWSRIVD